MSPTSEHGGLRRTAAGAVGLLALIGLVRRMLRRSPLSQRPSFENDKEVDAIATRLSQLLAEGDLEWLDRSVEYNDPEGVFGALRVNREEWDGLVQEVERLAQRHQGELRAHKGGG